MPNVPLSSSISPGAELTLATKEQFVHSFDQLIADAKGDAPLLATADFYKVDISAIEKETDLDISADKEQSIMVFYFVCSVIGYHVFIESLFDRRIVSKSTS